MTNDSEMKSATRHDEALSREDDEVAKLMHLAGPRPAIPRDVEERVHMNVRREWRRATQSARLIRWTLPLSLAAGVVIALAVYVKPTPVPAALVGTVSRVIGGERPGKDAIVAGQRVTSGATLATGGGQSLSVALVNGISLRLAASSTLRFDAPDRFTLQKGSVYADSGRPVYRDTRITVSTPFGTVTDVGTQFLVSSSNQNLRVAVREGAVDVEGATESWSANAGEMLLLRDGEKATFSDIPVDDEAWSWAIAVAPTFEIDNRSLLDFLTWSARETGKELVFESDQARMAAMDTILRGSVTDFSPQQATQAVLSTTEFKYRLEPSRIVISR